MRIIKSICNLLVLFALIGIFPVKATTIDILAVYTNGTANLYGGDATTRINQIIQATNQIYADSGVDLEIRLVNTLQVNYTDDNNAETALNDITFNKNSAFNNVASMREQSKADMVVFFRPYKDIHGSCGIAWIGMGTNGVINSGSKAYMYAHVAINTCGDYVTAHELGHNMGLKHSRKQDGVGGIFHYALGHGVVGSFTTIMAYQSEFSVDYWEGKIYKFSNPDIQCKNQPCGIDRNNTTNGADARYALNITGPQIANFYAGASTSSTSSSRSSSSSSSSSSRSSSSVGNPSISELSARVTTASQAVSSASSALAVNKTAIAEKTIIERNAQTALSVAAKNATQAKANYTKSVTSYNKVVTQANGLVSKINSALSAYNSATTAAKSTKLTQYNSLVAQYSSLQSQATSLLVTIKADENVVKQTTNLLTSATNAYAAAKAATAAEKALTAGLNNQLSSAKTALKQAETQYKSALKACKCG